VRRLARRQRDLTFLVGQVDLGCGELSDLAPVAGLTVRHHPQDRRHELMPLRDRHHSSPRNARAWSDANNSSSATSARKTALRLASTSATYDANSSCTVYGGWAIAILRISEALMFAWLTAALASRRRTATPCGLARYAETNSGLCPDLNRTRTR